MRSYGEDLSGGRENGNESSWKIRISCCSESKHFETFNNWWVLWSLMKKESSSARRILWRVPSSRSFKSQNKEESEWSCHKDNRFRVKENQTEVSPISLARYARSQIPHCLYIRERYQMRCFGIIHQMVAIRSRNGSFQSRLSRLVEKYRAFIRLNDGKSFRRALPRLNMQLKGIAM